MPVSLTTEARFFDGVTAGGSVVAVAVEADGLRLSRDGVEEMIPYAELRLISVGPAQLRFGFKRFPDQRLALPRELLPALQAAAPRLIKRSDEKRGLAVLVFGLVAASALILFAIFVLTPMAAEPLARMTPPEAEATLGRNVELQADLVMPRCKGPQAEAAEAVAAGLVADMAARADLAFPLRLTFADISTPNALALPGGRVIVTRGLLETLEAPDEWLAVIGHEIAHVEGRHGLVALYRRAGLGVLLDVVTGGSGIAQQVLLLSGQITELGFSRAQETEADRRSLELLDALGFDPGALARSFERLSSSSNGDEDLKMPTWFSSHPDTAARIAEARARAKPGRPQPLSPDAWAVLRSACGG